MWPLGPGEAFCSPDAVVEPDLPVPRPPRKGDPAPVDGTIVPAFADWHFHWVQLGIAGVSGAPLLDWLRQTAWPAELRYRDDAVSRADAGPCVERLVGCGTLAGSAWGSPHTGSVGAFLDAAGSGFVCGPAAMTVGPPGTLRQPVSLPLRQLRRLSLRHGRRVVASPRFALSCDAETLASLGDAARRWALPVQTHLAETVRECAAVAEAFPPARDYTDVYERAGLLGPRTLLGHCVHVSDDELGRIAGSGAIVVHCPTSNEALGSGRMPLERVRAAGAGWVLGSDVGAGPSPDMLDVVGTALRVHEDGAGLSAVEAFHRASIGRFALLRRRAAYAPRLPRLGDRPGVLLVDAGAAAPPTVAGGLSEAENWLRGWLGGRSDRRGQRNAAGLLGVLPWHALGRAG